MWIPTTMMVFLVLLIGSVIAVNVKDFLKARKYPYLSYEYFEKISQEGIAQDPKIHSINENLRMEMWWDFGGQYVIYAKNSEGEFIQVEKDGYVFNKPRGILKFSEPWKTDIEKHLENYRNQQIKQQQEEEKKHQQEIENIKANW